MASAFSHAIVAYTLGKSFSKQFHSTKFWIIAIVISILPDADVISFDLGIPYESFWGHRGFTHSFLFAGVISFLVLLLFYTKEKLSRVEWWTLFLFFFLCTASHGILDAMTNGGKGIAFFSPFENSRYFLPWRPIQISPVGASRFFSEWGLRVIKSEAIWIFTPCILILLLNRKSN